MSYKKSSLLMSVSAVVWLATAPAMSASSESVEAGTQVEGSMSEEIEADTLIGKNLTNAKGDTIGEINSVIIDGSGKVSAIIVGVGGFLSMGEREVAIDWNDLKINSNQDDIQTNLTKDVLKAMAEYKYEKEEYRKTAFYDDTYASIQNRTVSLTDTTVNWVAAEGVLASTLIGANVVNDQSETIGEVEDIVMNNNKPQLILSVGEFLGIGGHSVAVDLNEATISQKQGDASELQISVAMDKDQLKALPKFDLVSWKAKANLL